MSIAELRREYHRRICREIIRLNKKSQHLNFADKGSKASRAIAWGIVKALSCTPQPGSISGQAAGGLFERITQNFLEQSFVLLSHLRPGRWYYSTQKAISAFHQFEHLADLEEIIKREKALATALGTDYIVTPDIVVGRWPLTEQEINRYGKVVDPKDPVARLTPLRESNYDGDEPHLILHASISCKWTLRSDRSQNARTEALNLIRNRKGRLPHVVAVTAEPLPTRLASLALGTGDLDCVYHMALYELQRVVQQMDNPDQLEVLNTLVQGRRLADISDLPFDLAT